MCLAYPGKIIQIKSDLAIIDYNGEQRTAKIVNSEYKVGDYVIVQMGFIVQKLSKKEALDAIKAYSSSP
ncbi:HypC/HybG/HupF family hydrogenase formation chaperone [Candidatus Woesearchaeota archaeon]|nr:HypC/HybG/HupF family hydrogenase formation chaperone [Candidatus Woesearchaeota archaeon]